VAATRGVRSRMPRKNRQRATMFRCGPVGSIATSTRLIDFLGLQPGPRGPSPGASMRNQVRDRSGARMFAHFDLLHGMAGLFVGLLVGLTGVGGGSLMTPILVLLFGVAPATAVGTDLLFAAVTETAGSAIHGKRKTVDWHIMRRLAAGHVPAAICHAHPDFEPRQASPRIRARSWLRAWASC